MTSIKTSQEHTITIEDIVSPGTGLCKIDNFPIFVTGTLPGDKVEIAIIKKKRGYANGKVLKFLEKSKLRGSSKCEHFPVCGGCQFIDCTYDTQLKLKEDLLKDAIGQFYPKLEGKTNPIMGSKSQFYYRNKMEYAFATDEQNNIVLGLKKRGQFDQVVNLKNCHLQSELSDDIRHFTEHFFTEKELSTWNYKTHIGCLRHLMVRHAKSNDTYLINLVVSEKNETIYQEFTKEITKRFPEIISVYVSIQDQISDTAVTPSSTLLYGESHLVEQLGHLKFKISPQSFFQTNSKQAEVLYNTIRETASLKQTDSLLDLYCGTGTIGLYLADLVKEVIGIEEVPQAIADANENAKLNNISNANFYCGRVKNILKETQFQADCVIIDPPRSGMSKKAIKRILEINSPQLLYVSCNHMTLLRDLNELEAAGYKIESYQPIDMFPNTFHLESIVKCTKAN
jgi:23S rRNA (uracil1939-C5)-methyltransferase